MTYYIKGGSRFNEANPKVWVGLFLGGFSDTDYLLDDWKNLDDKGHETTEDPFWRMGGSAGGAKEFELGLWKDYRIKITTSGLFGWVGPGVDDFAALGGGGASTLDGLTDVTIDGTPADNEILAFDSGSEKWINQTASEAGLDIHPEDHDNTHHTTNYEVANANIQSHVASPVTDAHHTLYSLESHNNTYHSTNYHTESDGTGAVTVHSGITDAGSGIIISDGERSNLHTIYSLEQHDNNFHSTNYEVANANIQSHVASPVTDAHHTLYTLESHNNTYHSTNYHSESDGTGAVTVHSGITDAGSGIIISTGERNALHAIYTLEAHDLATTGVHQNSLPLSDLADYTAGRIIYGGSADWQFLALGTENYVLKAGATYPAWGQVDWGELTGSQPSPISHALDSHSVPTGSIAMSSQKFTGMAAGTINGDSVRFEQLHTKYTDEDARGAISDIIGADGKMDSPLDFDGNRIDNLGFMNLKTDAIAYRAIDGELITDGRHQGDAISISTNGGSFGVPMYSDSTPNRVSVCVDTSINTMPCIGIYVTSNLIFVRGVIKNAGWAFSAPGKPVYVNGSVCSTTIPPDVGDIVQVIGISLTTTSMDLNPSLNWVVRKV